MIIALKGENFTGKSGFGLGCPPRISWHETDIGGFERTIPHFETVNSDIRSAVDYYAYPTPQQYKLAELGIDTSPRLEGVKELWYQFVQNFLKGVDTPEVSSIVVDTFSQLYTICCDAYLQEKQEAQEGNPNKLKETGYREQLIRIEYRTVNQRMHAVFDVAADSKKVLVVTHHMSDVWGDVQRGEKIEKDVIARDAKGWHSCGYAASDLVDYVIKMEQGDPKKKYGGKAQDSTKFYSTFEKSGEARSLRGTVIEDMTYNDLISRVGMAKGV